MTGLCHADNQAVADRLDNLIGDDLELVYPYVAPGPAEFVATLPATTVAIYMQSGHGRLIERVVDPALIVWVAPVTDQICAAQDPHVVRDRALREAQDIDEVTDTQLLLR